MIISEVWILVNLHFVHQISGYCNIMHINMKHLSLIVISDPSPTHLYLVSTCPVSCDLHLSLSVFSDVTIYLVCTRLLRSVMWLFTWFLPNYLPGVYLPCLMWLLTWCLPDYLPGFYLPSELRCLLVWLGLDTGCFPQSLQLKNKLSNWS
jgi:hypothetical protein